MSLCSAEEIAEKRRIAQEKLRAKKLAAPASAPAPVTKSNQEQPAAKTNITTLVSKNNTSAQSNGSSGTSAADFINALKQNVPWRRDCNQVENNEGMPRKRLFSNDAPLAESPSKKPNAPVFGNHVSCKVYMINPYQFVVVPSGYHAKLIEVFKTIPSRCYNMKTKHWSFALKDYKLVQEKVLSLKPEIIMGVIPKSVIELCSKKPLCIDRSCLMSIESKLAEKLLPFQVEGVCFGIAQEGRVMICDEMGLGKTYQALAIADYYKDAWPLFIGTTASTRDSWAKHIYELLPSVPTPRIQVLTSNQQYVGDAKVLITSYAMMEKHYNKLMERKFGVIIFDESHTLKNGKAKCTIVAEQLAKQAQHIILLSGTPALSRPVELFSQITMINCKFMGYKDFTSRYCDGKQSHFGWDASGQSNLEELNAILKHKFMIRRTKADVLPDLTEKSRETVALDLKWNNPETEESLNTMKNKFSSSKGREREEILLNFYSRTAEVKANAVCDYIKIVLKENKKFIVFAHHLIMLNAITDFLIKQNVNYIRIDGSTKNEIRAEYVNRFQCNPNCKVAVLSLKACNSGITLTAAELILFAELDWNPSILAQAESRAHRIGQDKPVSCRYLMAAKTADDIIWNMLKNKQETLNKAGLFCEDLQDATHSNAPIVSPTANIKKYFQVTPSKGNEIEKKDTSNAIVEKNNHSKSIEGDIKTPTIVGHSGSGVTPTVTAITKKEKEIKTKTDVEKFDLTKELENFDKFFEDEFFDDDDDAFRDLIY